MHRSLLTIAAVLAAAATLALAGCVAEGTGSKPDDDRVAAVQPETRTPLSPYWDAMYGVYDARDEIEKRERVEELVATCMAAEGFDYTPIDQTPADTASSYEEGWGTENWAAEHGYGAFPTTEETAAIDAQVIAEDPNQEYVAGLSEKEQAAYYKALQSPSPDSESLEAIKDGETPAYDWENAGCQGAAQHEVTGDDPTQSERYAPLVAAMNALEQEQLTDPAMAPIDAEWSTCMDDAGYGGLATRQSAVDAVFAQSTEYWGAGASDEPSEELRAEWRAYEIEVAVADFRCAETVDYDTKELAVQVARETRFIDDNGPELDAMLAELAQGE
ncbi:hypothetical protein GCM10027413_30430 [Conyzicola nivalis]|uniref:Lipoprotein n=1 Tax=Conyzicola nivalis TaxID=1477021 RepID=A0A916STD7_9MICO|nr:hypothetical protein [Conyzicola nivalis]GGB12873.1 hypothetical protein GCM10010979_29080 [Conyzicola nivalis]